jgi:hypothetical protein
MTWAKSSMIAARMSGSLACAAPRCGGGALRPIQSAAPAIHGPSAKQAERRTTAARCLGGQGFWADRKAGGSQRLGCFLARQLRVRIFGKHFVRYPITCTPMRAVAMVPLYMHKIGQREKQIARLFVASLKFRPQRGGFINASASWARYRSVFIAFRSFVVKRFTPPRAPSSRRSRTLIASTV